MKNVQFVDSENMNTLEQYGASLLSAMISLKTLEAFHLTAFKKGLLDEDESETGKTICWEIQRLLTLYKTQVQHVVERTSLNEDEVLDTLKSMMPNFKFKKRRKNVKKL
jgi:hypothetical protein